MGSSLFFGHLTLVFCFPGKVLSASWSNIIYDIQMEEMFSSDSSCMEYDMSVLAILGSGLLCGLGPGLR